MLKKAIFKELFTEAKSVLESKAATKPSPDASGEGEAAILGDDSSSPVSFTELLSFVHEVKGCITNNDDGLTLLHVYRSIMSKIKDDVLAASHTALSIYDTALICINAIDAVVLPEWISLLADFCDKIGEEPQAEESTEDKHYRDALRAIFWDAPSNSINVQHVLGVVSVRCKFTFQAMHEITWTTAIASKMSLTDLGQSLLASLSGQDALIKMGRQRATFWSCFWARLQTLSSTSEVDGAIKMAYQVATTGTVGSTPANLEVSPAAQVMTSSSQGPAAPEHHNAQCGNLNHSSALLKLTKSMCGQSVKLRTFMQMDTLHYIRYSLAQELFKRGRSASKGALTLSHDSLATSGGGKVVAPFWGDCVFDITTHKLKLHVCSLFGVDFYIVPSNNNFCPAWMCKANYM